MLNPSPFDLFRRLPLHALLLALALGSLLAACEGNEGLTGPDQQVETEVERVEVTPGADTLTALGATRNFEAVALSADGDTVPDVTFSWSSSDDAAATVDEQGVVEGLGNGRAEIRASTDGVTGSAELAVIQQVETVSVSPSSTTLNTVGATSQFSADATDANGNEVSDAAIVWASENHAVATVDSSGVATSQGNGETTITATAQDVPGHGTLAVDQSIDGISFRNEPTDATAGEALDPAVQVAVLDADGNVVDDADVDVTLVIATNPGSGTLGGSKTVNAVNGVATFSGLWIDEANADYILEASLGGSSPTATSQRFDISAAAPDQLAYATEPTDATAGQAIGPAVEVEVQDEFGNVVPGSSADVSVELRSNPGGATLKGTRVATASSGVATFDDLNLEVAGTGYTLEVTSSGLGNETSGRFQVAPAAASDLSFTAGPPDAEGQEAIAPAVEVAIHDEFGNTVTSSSADVTVELADDPTGGDAILSGTTTVTASSGVATFDDLSVARPGEGFRVEATASGLTADLSADFAVNLTFVQTSVGGHHTCGVTVADHAYCWGANFEGRIGDGTAHTDRPTPVPVSGGHPFRRVRAGGSHTCGVTTADELFCWGANYDGQLGDGTTTDRTVPVAVDVTGLSTGTFALLSAGTSHTCAVTTDDEPFCWGRNTEGQLGDGTTTRRYTPVAVDVSGLSTPTFALVNAGGRLTGSHTCGITTAGEPFCWGDNSSGQLGDGTTTAQPSPVAVDVSGLATGTFADVSAGSSHTCGVTTAAEPFCWGSNADGQLGDGTTTDRSVPEAVSIRNYAVVRAGNYHTCGVTTADEPFCWGRNTAGQLGDGTTTDRDRPRAVATTGTFAHVSVGGFHTCALTPSDEAFCWGENAAGQVGDDSLVDRVAPARVVQ